MADLRHKDSFQPWIVECQKCRTAAEMWPDWTNNVGNAKCLQCGAIYQLAFETDYARRFPTIPFWFRADFRGEVFYALNSEHLVYLETVIQNPLRERPKQNGRREYFTSLMPFNLPAWMLSSKNREDVLKLIARLKTRAR